jgi:hypothetical protein
MAFLLLIAVLILLAGCKSEPEVLPQIIAWNTTFDVPGDIKLTSMEPDGDNVQLSGVKIAAEGPMIMVSFRGPSKLIDKWSQGTIYVVDEATKSQYGQITIAPVLGPLFSKPKTDNGGGYVMLDNPGGGIRPGSVVTVVLGNYKRVHITVE